jgi:hypothetical protein
MKPHESKKQEYNNDKKEGGKAKDDKKTNSTKGEDNKTLSKKSEKCREKNFNRRQEGTKDQDSGA